MKCMGMCQLVCYLFILMSNNVLASCHGQKMSKGWCWPTGTSSIGSYLDYDRPNPNYDNRMHLGQDIDADENDAVYAIADGIVLYNRSNVGGYGGLTNCSPNHADSIPGAGVIIKHKTLNGEEFFALYAHLKNVHIGSTVIKGEKIGEIRNYTACGSRMDHLHFGIRFPAVDDNYRWAGYEKNGNYYGFVDPIHFLNTHHPLNLSFYFWIREQNNEIIAWTPADVPCNKAKVWAYHGTCDASNSNPGICQIAYDELKAIDSDEYDRNFWRTMFFGSIEEFNQQCNN